MRFTSGSGAEVLMGASEGKSMLYLEARCIAVTRAAGAQGVQNGGIDGVNVTASVPDGMREVIAENLCVMLHDLESCTGNDTLMSASDIRRTAHTFPLLLAGSDFLFSGFGSIPAYDNAFGPSNMNAEDLDDYLVLQRDWGFEGGLRWRDDAELLPLRRRAAEACRAVFESLGLAEFTDEDVDACVRAHGSLDVPALPPELPGTASERILGRGVTALDAVRALAESGFEVEAERVLEMIRQRLLGDVLQTAAILDEDLHVLSSLSDPNDYAGPGTGYRMSPDRRQEVARVRHVWSADDLAAEQALSQGCIDLTEVGPVQGGARPDEVVVGLSPAFGVEIWSALNGMTVAEVLRQVLAGIEEEGLPSRLVRVFRSIDLGSIGWNAARLSGSGVSVGLQGKGTALIHRADLPPLANLELFSIAPRVTAELYRGLGRNAARYAKGLAPEPLLLQESSEPLGPRYHARVVQLVAIERRLARRADPVELEATWPS
jgi:propanediol dehydratase large subunit